MEEKKTIICKTCGRELSVDNFKKTRWGKYSQVCNECVTQKARETKKDKVAKIKEVETSQLQNARNLRLNDFTPRELMEELARRGYEGKLTFTEVRTIDITNF